MNNFTDLQLHTRGESVFTDDINVPKNTLYVSVYSSPYAHATIDKIDTSIAESQFGVHKVITWKDIPGANRQGKTIEDGEILAEKRVVYVGQPIALIVADSKEIADAARSMLKVRYSLQEGVFTAKEAHRINHVFGERKLILGDTDKGFSRSKYIVNGTIESKGQDHLYMETQSCIAIPQEGSCLLVHSSTQAPTAVQRMISTVLNIPRNRIIVDVRRIGGGFGGKEFQASPWACMAALASFLTNCSCKLILSRAEDLKLTGKRHPYISDYKIGLDDNGKILAFEVDYYQNAGAITDSSIAILEKTLYASINAYAIPNVKATGVSCQTNLPSFTAFRGFGVPQAVFVIEMAIEHISEKFGLDPIRIRELNLIGNGYMMPYGQKIIHCTAKKSWDQCLHDFDFHNMRGRIDLFNKENALFKKGLAIIPHCFPYSFHKKSKNQAGALVQINSDGSVSVSTGAVDMGQGVNVKIQQVVADIFGIDKTSVFIDSTNTSRVANTSATAASSGTDLNGRAAKNASEKIRLRLFSFVRKSLNLQDKDKVEIMKSFVYVNNEPITLSWEKLIEEAYKEMVDLRAHGFYAAKHLHFENMQGKFAYHVYGNSITEVTLNCLTGTYTINSIKIVHDVGESLNTIVDEGQIAGGLVQGVGWVTIEDLRYSPKGELVSDDLSSYKVPDIKFCPNIEIEFLRDVQNSSGLYGSKAVGEPSFMYGIGAYIALRNAIKAYRGNNNFHQRFPLTPENVFNSIYD